MPVKAKPLRGALRAAYDRRSATAQCVAMAERKPVRRFARTACMTNEEKMMSRRAEINHAWAEGFSVGKAGKSRELNPYLGNDSEKAKAWDQGWIEGNET